MTETVNLRSDFSVDYVQHMGSDAMVIAAARVSTKGAAAAKDEHANAEESRGLLNYLMRDRHGSPFEHTALTVRVEAPIFVFREWHRHRVQSFNEMSGRYTILKPDFYVPGPERPLKQVGKAGMYDFQQAPELYRAQHERMVNLYLDAWRAYTEALDAGVAKEVARAVLPVGIYSTMYATANLRAWLHFLGLRTKNEAATFPSFPQFEIAVAAARVEHLIKEHFPLTHQVWHANGRVAP